MRNQRLYLLSTVIIVLLAGTAWTLPGSGASTPSASHGSPDAALAFVPDQATVLDVARLSAGEVPAAGPAALDPGPPPDSKVIVVAGRGRGANTSKDLGRTQFEVPLFDVFTGEQVGRSTHDFICDGFLSCEDIDTYYLPEGTLRNKARVSFNQDGERPGWVLVGATPDVGPLDGTGIFAGKTGSVRVNGWANPSELPNFASLEELYIITVHP
jgi:hypothetical protein